jgi:hypothetical protein
MTDKRLPDSPTASGPATHARETVELRAAGGLSLGSWPPNEAARQARVEATRGRVVSYVVDGETTRLYRPEWAKGFYAFRLRCPRCRGFKRHPRSKYWCKRCKSQTVQARAAIGASNRRRALERQFGAIRKPGRP